MAAGDELERLVLEGKRGTGFVRADQVRTARCQPLRRDRHVRRIALRPDRQPRHRRQRGDHPTRADLQVEQGAGGRRALRDQVEVVPRSGALRRPGHRAIRSPIRGWARSRPPRPTRRTFGSCRQARWRALPERRPVSASDEPAAAQVAGKQLDDTGVHELVVALAQEHQVRQVGRALG